jgi:hypothetical protein
MASVLITLIEAVSGEETIFKGNRLIKTCSSEAEANKYLEGRKDFQANSENFTISFETRKPGK